MFLRRLSQCDNADARGCSLEAIAPAFFATAEMARNLENPFVENMLLFFSLPPIQTRLHRIMLIAEKMIVKE